MPSISQKTIVDQLKPHQLESGIVTQGEMQLARRWLENSVPFSFRCGEEVSDAILGRCEVSEMPTITDPDGRSEHKEMSWLDPVTGLRVIWQVRQFTRFPAVEWLLSFENTGQTDTPILTDIQALDMRLRNASADSFFTLHGANGGRCGRDDLMPFSRELRAGDEAGAHTQLGTFPSPGIFAFLSDLSSNTHLPFFNIESSEGHGVMGGIGWSGRWLADFAVEGNELRARGGMKVANFAIRPGERVRMPRILLLFWEGERLHGHNMFRQLIHQHYIPPLKGELQKPYASVNVCFTHHGRGGFLANKVTEEKVLSLVDPFSKLGAELLIIDAGWWECGDSWLKRMGDYEVSKTAFPRRLRPISDALSKAGMDFGLWFPTESVDPSLSFAMEYPNLVDSPETPFSAMWTPLRLRMEEPEARKYVLDAVDRLVDEEGMSCFRQDCHQFLVDADPNRQGITEIKHLTGLYDLWEAILSRHREMVMEGCCGGGRRIDLETVSHFHWHQKSDKWFDSVSDQTGLYGANLFLPGGVINIPTEGTDDFRAWSAFAGQFCLGWHPLDADFPMDQAQRQVERYKRIRPFLSGDFYPLTECSLDSEWLAYEFHNVDIDSGFALVFRRAQEGEAGAAAAKDEKEFLLHLRGLCAERKYRIRLEAASSESILSGAELAAGITLSLSKAPSAEMVIFEAVT